MYTHPVCNRLRLPALLHLFHYIKESGDGGDLCLLRGSLYFSVTSFTHTTTTTVPSRFSRLTGTKSSVESHNVDRRVFSKLNVELTESPRNVGIYRRANLMWRRARRLLDFHFTSTCHLLSIKGIKFEYFLLFLPSRRKSKSKNFRKHDRNETRFSIIIQCRPYFVGMVLCKNCHITCWIFDHETYRRVEFILHSNHLIYRYYTIGAHGLRPSWKSYSRTNLHSRKVHERKKWKNTSICSNTKFIKRKVLYSLIYLTYSQLLLLTRHSFHIGIMSNILVQAYFTVQQAYYKVYERESYMAHDFLRIFRCICHGVELKMLQTTTKWPK